MYNYAKNGIAYYSVFGYTDNWHANIYKYCDVNSDHLSYNSKFLIQITNLTTETVIYDCLYLNYDTTLGYSLSWSYIVSYFVTKVFVF